KSDGTADALATVAVANARYAAIGGTTLYIAGDDKLQQISTAGGSLQPIMDLPTPLGLTADETAAYIVSWNMDPNGWTQRISRVAAGTSTPVQLASATMVSAMTTDALNLYW